MATVLLVIYDDPAGGFPPTYARDSIPAIERYPDGQTAPTPDAIDFTPGELLGSVSGALGLRTASRSRAAGTSPTRSPAPTTSRGCRSAPSARAASARPSCGA